LTSKSADEDLDYVSILSMFSEISEVYIHTKSDHFYILIMLKERNKKADIRALVDCGASTLFISKRFMKEKQVRTRKLTKEIPVRNIDGMSNVAGPILCFAELGLKIGDHEEEKVAFMVTDLGSDDVIIGIDWLRYHNPEIDWNAGKFVLT
jgi:predicted aspartyl protease